MCEFLLQSSILYSDFKGSKNVNTVNQIYFKFLKLIYNLNNKNILINNKLILNNSVNPDKDYFSLYDIKNILDIDIDYIISKDFHIKNMDSLTLDGDIITIKNSNFKDYKVFKTIASDIVGGNYE